MTNLIGIGLGATQAGLTRYFPVVPAPDAEQLAVLRPDVAARLAFFNEVTDRYANSGHFQIVGAQGASDGNAKGWIEIEVTRANLLPIGADWVVLWESEDPEFGGPRTLTVDNSEVKDALPGLPDYQHLPISFAEGADLDAVWNQMISVATAIQDEFVGYGPEQNSNTFAGSVLWSLGINAQPFEMAISPELADQFPGLQSNVIQDGIDNIFLPNRPIDLTLTGDTDFDPADPRDTPNVDVFNGGAGDDRLSGGAGDDRLAGGNGEDVIEGGAGDDTIDIGNGWFLINQASGAIAHNAGGTSGLGDGDNDMIIVGENSGTDTIVGGGDAGDRIVFRLEDELDGEDEASDLGFELLGGLEQLDFGSWGGQGRFEQATDGVVTSASYSIYGSDLAGYQYAAWCGFEVTYALDGSDLTIEVWRYRAVDGDVEVPEELTFGLMCTVVIEGFVAGDFGIEFSEWDEFYEPPQTIINPNTELPDGIRPGFWYYENPANYGTAHLGTAELLAVQEPYEPDYSGTADDSGVPSSTTPGNDAVTLDPQTTEGINANFVDALEGNDEVTGSAGNDIIDGNDGDDTLLGRAGDDILIGGQGNDVINGGAGNDWVVYSGDAGVLVYLNTTEAQEVAVGEFDVIINVENAIGTNGDDLLFGNGRDNILFGMNGADELRGANGNDFLSGDGGEDSLFGGNGDDYLDGGQGDDRLHGGAGSDIFVFSAGSGRDIIADFTPGEDRIAINPDLWAGTASELEALAITAPNGNIRLDFGADVLVFRNPGSLITVQDIADALWTDWGV